ncbi:chemotaxis protein CheA [Edwardsiella piscicida]|nr:chemotaxis protein CheA [Edwardsiella piscicida]
MGGEGAVQRAVLNVGIGLGQRQVVVQGLAQAVGHAQGINVGAKVGEAKCADAQALCDAENVAAVLAV